MPVKKSTVVHLQTTPGLQVEWHVNGDTLVIDKSNVPITDELVDTIFPQWVQELITR